MTHFLNYDTDALIRKATVRTSLFGKKKCQINKETQGEMRVGEKNIDKASTQDTKGLDENREGEATEDDAQVDYSAGMEDNMSAEDMANMADELQTKGEAEAGEAPTIEDTTAQAEDLEAGREDVQTRTADMEAMAEANTELVDTKSEEIDTTNTDIETLSAELDAINAAVAEETASNAETPATFDGTGAGKSSAFSLSLAGEDDQPAASTARAKSRAAGGAITAGSNDGGQTATGSNAVSNDSSAQGGGNSFANVAD